ncbi:MAG: hypothetical protein L0G25_00960 [Psychrobacter sp.]|nr:hypothetical protein [Psychrobacter sp.]
MKKDFLLLSKSMTTLILLPTLLSLSAIGLSACGGFDDLDAARAAGAGIGSTVTTPNQPVDPEIQSNWRYSSSETDDTIFSVTANNDALNSFVEPNTNLRSTPRVELKKQLINNFIVESVNIIAGGTVVCLPSCDIRIRFDNQFAIYRMQDSGNGILKPANSSIEAALFSKFTTSNKAIVSLPIVGFGNEFDAEFDLRNYDPNRMSLSR